MLVGDSVVERVIGNNNVGLPDGVAKLEQRIDADGNVYTRVYKKPDADYYNAITADSMLVLIRKDLKEFFKDQ